MENAKTLNGQNLPNWPFLAFLMNFLSIQNVNLARFARNVEWDNFSNFQTMWHSLGFVNNCNICSTLRKVLDVTVVLVLGFRLPVNFLFGVKNEESIFTLELFVSIFQCGRHGRVSKYVILVETYVLVKLVVHKNGGLESLFCYIVTMSKTQKKSSESKSQGRFW